MMNSVRTLNLNTVDVDDDDLKGDRFDGHHLLNQHVLHCRLRFAYLPAQIRSTLRYVQGPLSSETRLSSNAALTLVSFGDRRTNGSGRLDCRC